MKNLKSKTKLSLLAFFIGIQITSPLFPPLAHAAPSSTDTQQQILDELRSIKDQVHKLEKTVADQKGRISTLEQENKLLKTDATFSQKTDISNNTPPSITNSLSNSGQFLPDIGVVGDIVGKLSKSDSDEEGNDRISVRELELVFGHEVDPYSRFDATIAFSDFEEPHVEEAFVTYWGLPLETRARIGRFHPKVGIASSLHRDELDSIDEPLVVSRYLGEEGLSSTGLELSNYLPLPWESPTLELTGGLLEGGVGHGAELLSENRRNPIGYLRARSSFELEGEDSLDIGSTLLSGSGDDDTAHEVQMYGLDFKYLHHLSGTSRLKLQGEIFFQDRSIAALSEEGTHEHAISHHEDSEEDHDEDHESEGEHEEDSDHSFNSSPYGYYLLADYRANERWSFGTRYDFVESGVEHDLSTSPKEDGISAILTYHQSEFARWRFQYQRLDPNDGENDDIFMLQALFAIGNHKHNLQ